ncbi:hypothetical protein [Fulvivirga ligni]|uniref:hypothetical protein n=1 Tax=Fulvivirga ligni TaxID=2904246 RepID=UPI001F2AC7AF|nr:hypothetical protein [Fulvivirga ligni]UII23158.1 hypothetical protein LVD16_07955 [Fulvivirga ligni]
MKTSTSISFLQFIEEKTEIQDFEKWIYESESLEEELPEETYTELISLDFNDKSIRNYVSEIITPRLDFGKAHKQILIALINDIIQKRIDPIDGLGELHYEWLDSKGYNFLSRNLIISNFGEQGKSILSRTDYKDELSIEEKWQIIELEDHSFIEELKNIKKELEDGKIELTGKFREVRFNGRKFEYKEN